jgi:hypothetical protein
LINRLGLTFIFLTIFLRSKSCFNDSSKLTFTSRDIITTHNNNNGGEKPFWEIFVSATHCGAGCTLDVISEWPVFIAGATIGVMLFASYVFDFVLAWFLGIIFQYLARVQMR